MTLKLLQMRQRPSLPQRGVWVGLIHESTLLSINPTINQPYYQSTLLSINPTINQPYYQSTLL
ncbi:MAG: hypothetical protein ACK5H5_04555, partial [Microcystis sp.]